MPLSLSLCPRSAKVAPAVRAVARGSHAGARSGAPPSAPPRSGALHGGGGPDEGRPPGEYSTTCNQVVLPSVLCCAAESIAGGGGRSVRLQPVMPLSEFQSVTKGKHDPGQPKVPDFSSAQSSFVPEHDFVELLWENGHVVMQGQSNRPKRSSFPGSFPSLGGKSKEKEVKDAVAPKSGRYQHVLSTADALGSDFQATGPPGQAALGGQDDDLVPWLNCPLDDYCAEFLSEFSGVNPNSLVPTDRISGFGQAPRDSHGFENGNSSRAPTGSSEVSRMNNHHHHYHQLFQLPQQYHNFGSGTRPKEPDLMMGAADQGPRGGDLPASTKVVKQDLTPSKPMHLNNNCSSGTPVMNFSHFTRPVALVKANLLSVDRARGSEKATTAASNNPLESTVIESAGGFKNVSASHGHLDLVAAKAESNPPVQPSEEMVFAGQPKTTRQMEATKNSRNHKKADNPSNRKVVPDNTKCQDSNFKATAVHETENHREPALASSSVCSAIGGAGVAANDYRHRPKWTCPEGEESECPSEDHDDDSTDVRRAVAGQGMSKKRSRAAEVHNLSERRRRDRINEKMRALQELIPNCNKVDKASMLDEAIEYLKTLQMQVQFMSMGGGLCMPPMMLPPGVQGMRPPHMAPFSPMAVGMGMGMGLGFGMGVLDMSRPPLMPIPRMHGPQYPCVSMPAAAGLHGMPGSANLQMFGMPGQPLPMSMTHPPPFIPLTGMPASVNSVASSAAATEAAAPVQASADSAPPNSKDQQLCTLEQVAKTSADNAPAESSRQANRECFELPSIVPMDNQQPPNVGAV
ncbi:hypothetical protein Taro_035097 [Colocasia esculenta]|uniref:BHLH domain-containing protein n=1 Tax=Colocasia esculenta TaxID=4460 RepID=A0A843W5P1_COLES|nr:hypothetical protein [Colocasia esculenta]